MIRWMRNGADTAQNPCQRRGILSKECYGTWYCILQSKANTNANINPPNQAKSHVINKEVERRSTRVIYVESGDLLEGGEGVDGESVGLDGAAVEDDLANVESGQAHLSSEDKPQHCRGHVHLMTSQLEHYSKQTNGSGNPKSMIVGEAR
ncbi:hypothetical protein ABZP36_003324 [Zizania latifolia]